MQDYACEILFTSMFVRIQKNEKKPEKQSDM